MIKSFHILVIFLIVFILFVTMSTVNYHVTTQLTIAAESTDVSADVNPHLTNITAIFQTIFGILSGGLAIAFIISLLIKKPTTFEGEWRG